MLSAMNPLGMALYKLNIIFRTMGQFDDTGDRLCGLIGSNASTHLISLRVSLYMQKIQFESLECSRSLAKHHWMK